MTDRRVVAIADRHIAMPLGGEPSTASQTDIRCSSFWFPEICDIDADCGNARLFEFPCHCHKMSEDRSSAFAARPTSKYGQLTMIRKAVNLRKSRKYSQGIGLLLSLRSRWAAFRFVSLFFAVWLTACGQPANNNTGQPKSENLVTQEDVCPTCNSNNRFAEKIQIDEVQGGREPGELRRYRDVDVPNEAFRSALEESLRNNGLLAEDASQARLILNTHLIDLGQGHGFSTTVFSTIRYVLRDEQTDEPVRDELVEARFTANFSDTTHARTRMIKAVEGSIRDNIRQFIVRLLTEFKPLTTKSSGASSEGRGSREG